MKRIPFHITLRRMANGADYSGVLFLHDASDAFAAMAKRLIGRDGIRSADALRLVTCNPATAAQVAVHRALSRV